MTNINVSHILLILLKSLEHTSAIILLALIAGLLFDFSLLKNYLTLLLATAMCFSLTSFTFKRKLKPQIVRKASLFLALNYILLPSVVLSLSLFFLKEVDYIIGFLILSLMPPAVIAIPYTFIFRGEKESAILAEIFGYLLAFGIVPMAFYTIFQQSIDLTLLLLQLLLFIVFPLLVSRVLVSIKKMKVKLYEKQFVNVCSFFLSATVLSLNKKEIFSLLHPHPIWLVLFTKAFVLPAAVYFILKKKMSKRSLISCTIFSTVKNSTLGMVIALSLFSPSAALPLVLSPILGVAFPIFLAFLFRR